MDVARGPRLAHCYNKNILLVLTVIFLSIIVGIIIGINLGILIGSDNDPSKD